jgi:Ser/Thr protein kinase RdoA (MazF antagonist)
VQPDVPAEVLGAYDLQRDRVRPLAGGLINQTYLVESPGGRAVLQRLHPIFGAAVHEDIEAVTRHLEAKGLLTPLLVRTRQGALCVSDAAGRIWRVLSFVEGITVHRVERPAQAEAAAGLVARFHRATADLRRRFAFVRPGVHDTPAHLAKLEAALTRHPDVPGRDAILRVADAILAGGRALPRFGTLPPRVVHGDLKISNVLFSPDDRALCLLDLDTLAELTIPVELGDALRSWCNPMGEDTTDPPLDLAIFEHAIRGYREAAPGLLGAAEVAALVPGFETICFELAARFCADALEDRYFGWDPARFPDRRAHNLVRARGQLALGQQVAAARGTLETIVARAFSAR